MTKRFAVAVAAIGCTQVFAQQVRSPSREVAPLFGNQSTPVGSPQRMTITDQKAFLPGEGDGGPTRHTWSKRPAIRSG